LHPEPNYEPSASSSFARPQESTPSPIRRFIAADGREWRVRESPLPKFDRRSGRCLIFETVDAARRIRDYPANWYELTEDELEELSERLR
jgi:sugar/nucleoside kinase (ribokinase family)